MPASSYLLCNLQYTKGEHKGVVVNRCATHKSADPLPTRDHVLRTENDGTNYFIQDSRYSLSMPVVRNANQCVEQTELFKMMCFTSCAGGINRRPTQLVVRLVGADSTVLARTTINLRVCACPSRSRAGCLACIHCMLAYTAVALLALPAGPACSASPPVPPHSTAPLSS